MAGSRLSGEPSSGAALLGSGTLNVIDSGSAGRQWLFTGNSPSFTGNITVGTGSAGSGFLQYRSSNPLPFGTATITVNAGGIFSADNGSTNPSTLSNNFILNGGTLGTQVPNMTYSGSISVTANSTIGHVSNGSGTIALSGVISGTAGLTINGGSTVTLSKANPNFSGPITVSGAVLAANLDGNNGNGSPQALGTGSSMTLDAGTFRFINGFSATLSQTSLTITGNGGTLDDDGGFPTFGGAVFWGGALLGSGTLNVIDSGTPAGNGSSPGTAHRLPATSPSGPVRPAAVSCNTARIIPTPFGSATITVLAGGVFSADNGSTTPSTLKQ